MPKAFDPDDIVLSDFTLIRSQLDARDDFQGTLPWACGGKLKIIAVIE